MARFQLRTQYTFTLPAGELSPAGVYELMGLITAINPMRDEWAALNPDYDRPYLPDFPTDWQWTWVVQKGEYAGTLPKRIRNYYFKAHKIKCPDSFIEQIGNIARQHTDTNSFYRFEIVDEFDWQAGDFGDYGSCYWGGNAGARLMLRENGGMAICFMTDSGTGYARAWLVEIDTSLYIIFNGYGFEKGVYATLTIARVFATFLNLSYKKIALDNSTGSTLYINGDTGYIIGTPESIDDIEEWDFEWDEAYADTCYSCGCLLGEYDYNTGTDDNTYCDSCFQELFDRCEWCYETYRRDEVDYVASVNQYVCDYCRGTHFDLCYSCDEWFLKENMHLHDDDVYCWQCLNKITSPPGWAE